MSRHGYTDDHDDCTVSLALYMATLARAIRGKRGQLALRDLIAALDAMPQKRLVSSRFRDSDGECCALGALAVARGVIDRLPKLTGPWEDGRDPEEDHPEGTLDTKFDSWEIREAVAAALDIAPSLASEVMYQNDDCGRSNETPEQRWTRIRAWAARRVEEPRLSK
jgi:hypothetical protein